MRLLALFFAFAALTLGQSSVRPGGRVQSGPGRVASPPARTSVIQPGVPDARLGAGGVRPNTGNILYPGTPSGGRPGNILFPGTPAAQPIPSVVQPPAQQPHPPFHGDGRGGKGRHGRRFAGDYPVYGFYPFAFAPNVIAVPGSTMTRSGSGYVITVGDDEGESDSTEIPSTEAASSEAAGATDPDYWLIALRGGLIYAVSDYTIEARALRFMTLQGDEYVVPLAELDRGFTVKLNQDRGVRIELE